MSTTSKRILYTCLTLMLGVCVCLSIVSIIGAGFWIVDRTESINIPGLPTAIPDEVQTGNVDAQMDLIQKQVIEMRGLQTTGEISRTLLTPDELRQHVLDNFLNDYTAEEAKDDALTLAAFGLLDSDFNLYDFFLDLYSEQIAGYYDDETKEMFVVKGEGFLGSERLTYAHEYVHALQDQNFDIKDGLAFDDELCESDSERCAAIQALLEGDASLSELNWFSIYATEQDRQEIADFYNEFSSPIYDSAPEFMKEDFIFPYTSGRAFVESLYSEGDWAAVDQAYKELPVSTEQILHPERYPDDQPIAVAFKNVATVLGDEWREIDKGVLGEWYTYLLLAYGLNEYGRLPADQAESASEGWGGDTYQVFYNDTTGELALALYTTWDTVEDAEQFTSAFHDYANARFGQTVIDTPGVTAWQNGNEYHEFRQDGANTAWIFAPSQEITSAIWEQLSSR